MRVQSPGGEDTLEEGMATLSSILAWRIPSTEEPGGPKLIGTQSIISNSYPHSDGKKQKQKTTCAKLHTTQ